MTAVVPRARSQPHLVSPRVAPAVGQPPLPGQTVGEGWYSLASRCDPVAVAFSDHTEEPPALFLSTFSPTGLPNQTVKLAQTRVTTPNPGVGALPVDEFVAAWTNFNNDELGLAA
jgi:hypothetical protein